MGSALQRAPWTEAEFFSCHEIERGGGVRKLRFRFSSSLEFDRPSCQKIASFRRIVIRFAYISLIIGVEGPSMKKGVLAWAVALFIGSGVFAQTGSNAPPSEAELTDITARGRALAEYDAAAWHATDAVVPLNPTEGTVERYVARKTE